MHLKQMIALGGVPKSLIIGLHLLLLLPIVALQRMVRLVMNILAHLKMQFVLSILITKIKLGTLMIVLQAQMMLSAEQRECAFGQLMAQLIIVNRVVPQLKEHGHIAPQLIVGKKDTHTLLTKKAIIFMMEHIILNLIAQVNGTILQIYTLATINLEVFLSQSPFHINTCMTILPHHILNNLLILHTFHIIPQTILLNILLQTVEYLGILMNVIHHTQIANGVKMNQILMIFMPSLIK